MEVQISFCHIGGNFSTGTNLGIGQDCSSWAQTEEAGSVSEVLTCCCSSYARSPRWFARRGCSPADRSWRGGHLSASPPSPTTLCPNLPPPQKCPPLGPIEVCCLIEVSDFCPRLWVRAPGRKVRVPKSARKCNSIGLFTILGFLRASYALLFQSFTNFVELKSCLDSPGLNNQNQLPQIAEQIGSPRQSCLQRLY